MIKHESKKIQNAIQMELFKAENSIKIAVAWFTNELLLKVLVLKLKLGVTVEIILNDDEINRTGKTSLDFTEFIKSGGILRWNKTNKLMHDKFCVIDDHIVIFGSYNWTNKAEYSEESVTISIDENDTTNFFLAKFNRMSNLYTEELERNVCDRVETKPVEIVSSERFISPNFPNPIKCFEIVSQNGKRGIRHIKGEMILDIMYQDIYKIGDYFCVKRFMESSQLFSPFLKSFVGPTFDSVEQVKDFPDYLIKKNGKLGYLDYSGICIINCDYDKIEHIASRGWAYDFMNGFKYSYLVEKDGYYGIYTKEGRNIIPCKYENITPLLHGFGFPPMYYIVKKGKKALFDPKNGKQITDFLYDSFKVHFYETINISVEKNKKYALMSLKGVFLTDFIYDSIKEHCLFLEEKKNDGVVTCSYSALYDVEYNNNWGIIDSEGNITIECKYKSIEDLENSPELSN